MAVSHVAMLLKVPERSFLNAHVLSRKMDVSPTPRNLGRRFGGSGGISVKTSTNILHKDGHHGRITICLATYFISGTNCNPCRAVNFARN